MYKTVEPSIMDTTPKISTKKQVPQANVKLILYEKKLIYTGLFITLALIVYQILIYNREYYGKLMTVEPYVILCHYYQRFTPENGVELLKSIWIIIREFRSVWMPILAGSVFTYFSWMMIYMDSREPGVDPPSPLSPSKNLRRSGHRLQINYLMSIVFGIGVGSYLYVHNNVAVQY